MTSPERSLPRRCIDWAHRVLAALLVAHFAFSWALAQRVSWLSVICLLGALLLLVPLLRRKLSGLPLLLHGWVRAVVLLSLLLAANWLLANGDRPEIVRAPHAFVGATILTGEFERAAIEDGVVLVDAAGLIVEVGDRDGVDIPEGYDVVDLRGKVMLPGLLNAHGHLMLPGRPAGEAIELSNFAMPDWVMNSLAVLMRSYPGERLVLWQMQRNARLALEGGVTTLRGLGDPGFLDVELRDRIAAGRALGPRILASGPLLCTTGGHGHQIAQVIDGADEARRAVRNALFHRVDHIKVASTGGVSDSRRIGEAGELQMTPEEIAAVTDEAHRRKVLVAAHAESSEGVLEALRAGVDSIEHGASLDPEAIALFLDNPRSLRGYTTLHPTLSVIAGPLEVTDEVRANPALLVMVTNGMMIRDEMIAGYRQAVEAGVRIGVGTDAGIVSHRDVWKEMLYFVEQGGVTPEQALYWGTLGTARSIGVEALTGSIEVGKFADLLVVDADPRQRLDTLGSPYLVVAAGGIHEPE